MDFWKIDNKETSVKIKWSHNFFEDYKTLSYQFYKCVYKTFEEVIGSGHDNVKSDMWFLTGIFLVRHSIELVILQVINSCNLCVTGSGVNGAFFTLFAEFENLVSNFIVGYFVVSLFEKIFLKFHQLLVNAISGALLSFSDGFNQCSDVTVPDRLTYLQGACLLPEQPHFLIPFH